MEPIFNLTAPENEHLFENEIIKRRSYVRASLFIYSTSPNVMPPTAEVPRQRSWNVTLVLPS